MRTTAITTALVLFGTAVAVPAIAQDVNVGEPQRSAEFDANDDGMVEKSEFMDAYGNDDGDKVFNQFDTDKDGAWSDEEQTAFDAGRDGEATVSGDDENATN